MNRFERDELAELHNRALAGAREEAAAIYAVPLDMGQMVRTADFAREANREFWQALFRLGIDETSESPRGFRGFPEQQL